MPADPLTVLADRIGDRTALVDDRPDGTLRTLSFAELNRDANRLANALLARGVKRGDKVAWCGMNSIDVVRLTNAARKIAATAVPLNYRLTPEEAAYVVDDCDAVLVWVDAEFAGLIREIRNDTPKVRDVVVYGGPAGDGAIAADELLDAASAAEPSAPGDEPAATIIYTSGTTGKPKGAMRRGVGDPQQIAAMVKHVGYRSEDVYLTTGPLYHSGPGGFLNLSQLQGHTCVLQRRFDAEDWLRLVEKHRVTTTFSAPTPIRMVCNLDASVFVRHDVSSMRRMIANAAPWSYALKELYLERFPEDSLFEIYGSTELGVNTILRPEDQRRAAPAAAPRPGWRSSSSTRTAPR